MDDVRRSERGRADGRGVTGGRRPMGRTGRVDGMRRACDLCMGSRSLGRRLRMPPVFRLIVEVRLCSGPQRQAAGRT